MLVICSLSMLESWMRHCLCLFLWMTVGQLWREKERFRVRAVQMDTLRRWLGIRRMDRIPNTRIRELSGVKKGLDERIDEGLAIRRGWRGI